MLDELKEKYEFLVKHLNDIDTIGNEVVDLFINRKNRGQGIVLDHGQIEDCLCYDVPIGVLNDLITDGLLVKKPSGLHHIYYSLNLERFK